MPRKATVKTTIALDASTVAYLEGIAETFEDHVSRGELVDMMAAHVAENKLEDEVFGTEDEDETEGKPEDETDETDAE